MSEILLTVEQAATRLQMHPITIRRQIKRGTLKAVRAGRQFRIPESELTRPVESETPQTRAAHILAEMRSGVPSRRLAAIRVLARADAATYELVEAEVQRAEAAYTGPQDDMSDWRALDCEPFHFPEESPDYLQNLYRADKTQSPVVGHSDLAESEAQRPSEGQG